YDHCIFIGKCTSLSARHVVYALASGWRCFVSENQINPTISLLFNPFACFATAALAAMFVYRRAERIELLGLLPLNEINGWSLLEYQNSEFDGPPLPTAINVGTVFQAGLGGTANALLSTLRFGPELLGHWFAYEHETADLSNWNRYLLMYPGDANTL